MISHPSALDTRSFFWVDPINSKVLVPRGAEVQRSSAVAGIPALPSARGAEHRGTESNCGGTHHRGDEGSRGKRHRLPLFSRDITQ